MNKLPWVSLLILFVTYAACGWTLPAKIMYWYMWLFVSLSALIICLFLTSSLKIFDRIFSKLLATDNRAFILAILFSLTTVIFFRWINIAVRILLLVCATILARLDLQVEGFTKVQAFFILYFFSLLGLGTGILLHIAIITMKN
ncbi:MAG TPA: hypothetical protein V6C58_12260 [Allocoleopsis sp.]